jgi:hypothetical protein
MTTVPSDPMLNQPQPPDTDKANPSTGKGLVDARPPSQGFGPGKAEPITGKGKGNVGGVPLNKLK